MWNSTFKDKPRKPLKRSAFKKKVYILKRSKTPLIARKRRGLAKTRQDTVGKLKQKIWAITRQIIIKLHGSDCYTCPARTLTGSNRHIGHFIASSVCSAQLRYSLENLRPQCYRCNIHLSGNWIAFEAHLRQDGIDVEELKRRNEATKGKMYDRLFYQQLLAEREELFKSMGE